MGGRCAQDIAGAVIPVNGSGCPLRRRVVQRIRDVRQVNITVAVRHHHFGGDRIMTHKYCGIHRCGGVLVVVILCGHGGNVVPGPSPGPIMPRYRTDPMTHCSEEAHQTDRVKSLVNNT